MLVGEKKLARISVRRVVQGAGFRPFVYRLAQEYNFRGWVHNTSGSVQIEVEGDSETLAEFLSGMNQALPGMSEIMTMKCAASANGSPTSAET